MRNTSIIRLNLHLTGRIGEGLPEHEFYRLVPRPAVLQGVLRDAFVEVRSEAQASLHLPACEFLTCHAWIMNFYAWHVKHVVHDFRKKLRETSGVVDGWYDGWGKLLQEARDAADWSQARLADETGLDPSLISRYELEKVSLKPEPFRKLTNALRGLSAAELLNAMGYEVTVPGADRLPKALIRELLLRSPDEWDALVKLLRGSPPQGRPRQERAQ